MIKTVLLLAGCVAAATCSAPGWPVDDERDFPLSGGRSGRGEPTRWVPPSSWGRFRRAAGADNGDSRRPQGPGDGAAHQGSSGSHWQGQAGLPGAPGAVYHGDPPSGTHTAHGGKGSGPWIGRGGNGGAGQVFDRR